MTNITAAAQSAPRPNSSCPIGRFGEMIGPIKVVTEGDQTVLSLTPEERHMGPSGRVHPGVLLTLAEAALDAAAGDAACRTGQPVSLNTDLVTMPEPGVELIARAEVTRATRSVIFLSGEVRAGGKLILTATGIWRQPQA